MGSRLVKRALATMAGDEGLGTVARLTLVVMALHSLDSPGRNKADPPGVYWGGHAQLGREVFGEFTRPSTSRRAITRAIRELESRKLIRVYDENVGGNRAYLLFPYDGPGGDT
jgi:hypothetical protein